MRPAVTVLMAVRNGGPFLRAAVGSILGQTFGDFELLVVDDGSTDETAALLAEFRSQDPRVRVHAQSPRGLATALNVGLELARGGYVARMDADDESVHRRLALQVSFMDAHPAVGVCGTWLALVGDPSHQERRFPCDDSTLRCRMIFENPIAHPTVILRRSPLLEAGLRYDETLEYAQDYDLWVRASRVTRLANLPAALVRYRIHPLQASARHLDRQQAVTRLVQKRQIARLRVEMSESDERLHEAVSTLRFQPSRDLLDRADAWLLRLSEANRVANDYPVSAFDRVLARQWLNVCVASVRIGWPICARYLASPLSRRARSTAVSLMRLGARCALGPRTFLEPTRIH